MPPPKYKPKGLGLGMTLVKNMGRGIRAKFGGDEIPDLSKEKKYQEMSPFQQWIADYINDPSQVLTYLAAGRAVPGVMRFYRKWADEVVENPHLPTETTASDMLNPFIGVVSDTTIPQKLDQTYTEWLRKNIKP